MRMGFLPDQVLPLTATLGYVPVRLSGIVAVNGDFLPIACTGLNDSILIYNEDDCRATHLMKDWLVNFVRSGLG